MRGQSVLDSTNERNLADLSAAPQNTTHKNRTNSLRKQEHARSRFPMLNVRDYDRHLAVEQSQFDQSLPFDLLFIHQTQKKSQRWLRHCVAFVRLSNINEFRHHRDASDSVDELEELPFVLLTYDTKDIRSDCWEVFNGFIVHRSLESSWFRGTISGSLDQLRWPSLRKKTNSPRLIVDEQHLT